MDNYEKQQDWYSLIPLAILVIFLPLIVYLKVLPLGGPTYDFWNGAKIDADFFSYYKGAALLILTSISLLLIAYRTYCEGVESIRKTYSYIPMAIFMIWVILSALHSKYVDIALGGFVNRYEGMYILLAYMLLLFVTINAIREELHVKLLLIAISVGMCVVCSIGFFQYLGFDLWKTSFGKDIMLPLRYKNISDQLGFSFDKYQVYSTLYHYNYVGSYTAMLFPMCTAFFLLVKGKSLKIITGILTLLTAINWIGCNARSGMIGAVVAFIVLAIMMNKQILKKWKLFATLVVLLVIVIIGVNAYSKGAIATRVKSLTKDIVEIIGNKKSNNNAEENIPLKDIKVNRNVAEITTSSEILKIEVNNGELSFLNQDNKPVLSQMQNGKIKLASEIYKDYDISRGSLNDKDVLQIIKGNIKLFFQVTQDKIIAIDNKTNEMSLDPVEKWGFEGHEKLGSSRGYIWSRSIPLLKNTKWLGYGPDTFAIYFPQQDIKGKMYAYDGDMWQLVDKPHDFYLQTALNTGIPSLIALLALFIMYIVSSIRLYIKSQYEDFLSIAGVAVFIGICGYLGAAIFNDSVVSVAPLFWVMLGLGISTNHIVQTER